MRTRLIGLTSHNRTCIRRRKPGTPVCSIPTSSRSSRPSMAHNASPRPSALLEPTCKSTSLCSPLPVLPPCCHLSTGLCAPTIATKHMRMASMLRAAARLRLLRGIRRFCAPCWHMAFCVFRSRRRLPTLWVRRHRELYGRTLCAPPATYHRPTRDRGT